MLVRLKRPKDSPLFGVLVFGTVLGRGNVRLVSIQFLLCLAQPMERLLDKNGTSQTSHWYAFGAQFGREFLSGNGPYSASEVALNLKTIKKYWLLRDLNPSCPPLIQFRYRSLFILLNLSANKDVKGFFFLLLLMVVAALFCAKKTIEARTEENVQNHVFYKMFFVTFLEKI
jgi:hypothetical protein